MLTKLYVAWPRVAGRGTEDAYARRILTRAHVDEWRRPWRRRERPGLDDVDRPDPQRSDVEGRDALVTALLDLPVGQRRVVVLRHWWGMSVEETAAELECSTGTVKSQTARALARLQAALSERPVSRESER